MTDNYDYTNELTTMYNDVFSLIEEELYQRLHPESYHDKFYDGTRESICGSSNLDINFDFGMNKQQQNSRQNIQHGGQYKRTFIPGKFDVIRSSYQIPFDVAIKGTIERQRLFLQEHYNNQ